MKKNPAAVALGKLGGKSRSDAKVAAVRSNGKMGGRPRNVDIKGSVFIVEDIEIDRPAPKIQKYQKNPQGVAIIIDRPAACF